MNLPAARTQQAPSWLVWAALWTVYIVWGSTYLAIRVSVETLPPLLAASFRFVVAGALMALVLMIKRGPRGIAVSRRELLGSTLIGSLLLLGGNGIVMLAERDVPSGLAALIIASVPLWVVLLRFVARERIDTGTLIGVAIGFVGVGLLVVPGEKPDGASVVGMLALVLASLFWGTGSFLSKRVTLPSDPLTSTAWQMLLGGLVIGVAGLGRGELSAVDASRFSAASVWALVYLIFVGSLIAFTAYVWVLQHAPISKVATYAYVNPVIAIFLGWLILSEEITPMVLGGAAVIVASVAFIVRRESTPAPERHEAPDAAPALVGAEVS